MTPKEERSGITQADVRNLFIYDPETGFLTRRFTRGRHGCWKAGERVGSVTPRGYRCVSLPPSKQHQEHRIIWLYVTGHWPEHEIDHANGCSTDNRWINLRACLRANNLQNTKRRSDNLSGIKGVSAVKTSWRVQLKRPDGTIYNKSFRNKEDAARAYENEARRVFGEFARVA